MRILLDSNLLILWVAGYTDPRLISSHKRLKAYTAADYNLLSGWIGQFQSVLLLPNTLTEASNLLAQIQGPAMLHLRRSLQTMIAEHGELYVASRTAASHSDYLRLGLTDAAILAALGDGTVLLTADFDLYVAAVTCGFKAATFDQIRDADERSKA